MLKRVVNYYEECSFITIAVCVRGYCCYCYVINNTTGEFQPKGCGFSAHCVRLWILLITVRRLASLHYGSGGDML